MLDKEIGEPGKVFLRTLLPSPVRSFQYSITNLFPAPYNLTNWSSPWIIVDSRSNSDWVAQTAAYVVTNEHVTSPSFLKFLNITIILIFWKCHIWLYFQKMCFYFGKTVHVESTRWFKYGRDKLWLIYTQSVPVIFEPPCTTYRHPVAYWVKRCFENYFVFCTARCVFYLSLTLA